MHTHGMWEVPTFGSLGSEIFLGIGWIWSSAPQHPCSCWVWKLSCVLAALSSWVLLPSLCNSTQQDGGPSLHLCSCRLPSQSIPIGGCLLLLSPFSFLRKRGQLLSMYLILVFWCKTKITSHCSSLLLSERKACHLYRGICVGPGDIPPLAECQECSAEYQGWNCSLCYLGSQS